MSNSSDPIIASDTPRTDAEAREQFNCTYWVRADFARTLERENAQLREALETALCRAYAAGYQHGHHDTVEAQFYPVHDSDVKDYFADNVRQMLLDGSQPELAALAATKGPK